jgi:Peptidase A4 family
MATSAGSQANFRRRKGATFGRQGGRRPEVTRGAFIRGLVLACAVALAAPAAAVADASLSTNWAGFAVHRAGVRFRNVSATWTEPAAACHAPNPTWEATWVGIGGYNRNSNALEQIGTELDCAKSGATLTGAWYEVVPAPSKRIGMAIRPGDTITASVTVVGRRVTLKLADRSRHESFSRRVTVSSVDIRSAEWIVEAPSACFTISSCHTLPLTDFGTESFRGATATTTQGHRGSIASSRWGRSKITLAPGGTGFISSGAGARAVPSGLSSGGSAFSVTFSRSSAAAARDVLGPRATGSGPPTPVNSGGARR